MGKVTGAKWLSWPVTEQRWDLVLSAVSFPCLCIAYFTTQHCSAGVRFRFHVRILQLSHLQGMEVFLRRPAIIFLEGLIPAVQFRGWNCPSLYLSPAPHPLLWRSRDICVIQSGRVPAVTFGIWGTQRSYLKGCGVWENSSVITGSYLTHLKNSFCIYGMRSPVGFLLQSRSLSPSIYSTYSTRSDIIKAILS